MNDDGVMAEQPPSGTKAAQLDDIVSLLAAGAAQSLPGLDASHHLLDHSLQTAAVLASQYPEDLELQVGGLVHDIGHLLSPLDDDQHGEIGADFVGPLLGERVAEMVRLHVEAKRYLVATDPTYFGVLAADSVASLALQGGAMTPSEVEEFAKLPHAHDAVTLRRADDQGKVVGLVVAPLSAWTDRLVEVQGRLLDTD
jgi:predicted HD phosphohydrolase